MKIVIENDWTSYYNLSGDIRIEVTEEVAEPDVKIKGQIMADQFIGWIPITVPAGTTQAIVELGWKHD